MIVLVLIYDGSKDAGNDEYQNCFMITTKFFTINARMAQTPIMGFCFGDDIDVYYIFDCGIICNAYDEDEDNNKDDFNNDADCDYGGGVI